MLKYIILVPFCVAALQADGPVLKTGQSTVYRSGDDGTYQRGIARSYTRSTSGVVTDSATNLQWQDDYSDYDGNVRATTWPTAVDYCANLTLEGSGWRLPSHKELLTIVDRTRSSYPKIDPVFQTTRGIYWSSDSYLAPITSAEPMWAIDFITGQDQAYDKTDNVLGIRCVRGGVL